MAKTSQQLSDWALWVYDSKWIYAMGCYGQRLQTQYPILAKSWYYTVKNPGGFVKLTTRYNAGENPRLYDCHGIVDGFRMDDDTTAEIEFDPSVDTSADYEMNRVQSSGVLGKDYGPVDATMKDNAGYGYWKDGHFGVGVGNGEVVDIWSTGDPARKRDQSLGNWTNWLKCYGIDYGGASDMNICVKGEKNELVRALQHGLYFLDYDMGDWLDEYGNPTGCDASYGTTTANRLAEFKSKYGLPGGGGVFNVDDNAMLMKEMSKVSTFTGITQAELDAEKAKVSSLTGQVNDLNLKYNAANTGLIETTGMYNRVLADIKDLVRYEKGKDTIIAKY